MTCQWCVNVSSVTGEVWSECRRWGVNNVMVVGFEGGGWWAMGECGIV